MSGRIEAVLVWILNGAVLIVLRLSVFSLGCGMFTRRSATRRSWQRDNGSYIGSSGRCGDPPHWSTKLLRLPAFRSHILLSSAMEELNNQTTGNLFTDPSHPLHFSPYFLLLPLLAYPVLVALLRHHRLRTTLEDYPYTTRRSYASMTSEDAFYIQQRLGELEFPFIFEKALQFALFRTYGIPTISKLLVQTSQFSEQATASKRYADTSVLIAEFAGYHPKSPRAIEAIGRMNFIHSHYQRSGKILDDDMLYTLSLFALEPIRWIARYEWRELDEFEKAAVGTFWKGVGDAMGVKFDKLKGGGKGGGWTDGLQWLEEVEEWAQAYEKRCMVPDENNRKTAEQTVTILLWTVPQFLKPYGKKIVSVLMDDRLRKAMMYESSPTIFDDRGRVLTIRLLVTRNPPVCILSSSPQCLPSVNTPSATFSCLGCPSCPSTIPPTALPKMVPIS